MTFCTGCGHQIHETAPIPAIVALVEGIRYLTRSEADFQHKAAQMDGPFAFLW